MALMAHSLGPGTQINRNWKEHRALGHMDEGGPTIPLVKDTGPEHFSNQLPIGIWENLVLACDWFISLGTNWAS